MFPRQIEESVNPQWQLLRTRVNVESAKKQRFPVLQTQAPSHQGHSFMKIHRIAKTCET